MADFLQELLGRLRTPPSTAPPQAPRQLRTAIVVHGQSPVCALLLRAELDWALEPPAWEPRNISGRWPLRAPWWDASPRPQEPFRGGVIQLGVLWDCPLLPDAAAASCGLLLAQLMEGYNCTRPAPHYVADPRIQGCPPWEPSDALGEALAREREKLRLPLMQTDERRRR